jgi:hypothetical protein
MWDEMGDDQPIKCPECGADTDSECPHVLAIIDVTFGACEGGAAFHYWDTYSSRVKSAFKTYLASSVTPKWKHFEVENVWDNLEVPEDLEDLCLPFTAFADLIVAVLEAAGGYEHHGNVMSESGGRCQSAMRILYAEKPKQVCKKSVTVLEQRLAKVKVSRRR